jgi:hypothetical protein
LEGISEDGPNETQSDFNANDNDLAMLEKLFKKVQKNQNIDKVKLFNQLINQTGAR